MKIYTKVVFDWDGNILEEESYDYTGPVALAGGGGGSKTSTTTVQQADPWVGQQPYLREVMQQAQMLHRSSGPELYSGDTVVGYNADELTAQNMAKNWAVNAQAPLATQAGQANQFLMTDVMTADTNPYMADYARGAIQPVMNELTDVTLPGIRAAAAASGNLGSSRQGIAEGLAIDRATQNALNTTSQIYSDAYGKNLEGLQRGIALAPQTSQTGLMPAQTISSVGSQTRAYEQAVLNDAIRRFEYEEQLPYNKLAAYQNIVQGQYGGTGSSMSTASGGGPSAMGSIVGAAGTGLSTYGGLTAMGDAMGGAMGGALVAAAPWAAAGLALASLFA